MHPDNCARLNVVAAANGFDNFQSFSTALLTEGGRSLQKKSAKSSLAFRIGWDPAPYAKIVRELCIRLNRSGHSRLPATTHNHLPSRWRV
jgi:hypothetical protein